MVSDAMRRSVRWPKAPNGLGNALRRMATNLRAAGVELQFSRNDVQGRRVVSWSALRRFGKHRQLLSAAARRRRYLAEVGDPAPSSHRNSASCRKDGSTERCSAPATRT